jgi:formylglycine-generating enzyme required for sulfatase activity
MMGSDDGNRDEQPAHQVCFDQPFWIDRTEVSNHQFAQLGGEAAAESAEPGQ